MKILFYIYHVQIMQGDIITRIRSTIATSATTTWPACRAEAKSAIRQEINYPPVHAGDPGHGLYGLRGPGVPSPPATPSSRSAQAVKICDV